MKSNIENWNGRNTVVVKFDPDSQFNQNSRLQLTIEDAAKLMKELLGLLAPYQPQNESEFNAIRCAMKFGC